LAPYDLEVERAVREVVALGAKKVMIQAPDGLKQYLGELCKSLEAAGVSPLLSTEPCYGGCDVADGAPVGADAIIHVGHFKFGGGPDPLPTVYITAKHLGGDRDLPAKAARAMKARGFRKVGLVSNAQHIHLIGEFREALAAEGLEGVVDGETGGLVLGCRVGAATAVEGAVDALVFIGGGDFHALGVALACEKEVFIADPYRGEVRETAQMKRRALAKRWWLIAEASKAKTFGVVIVTKPRQMDLAMAERLSSDLRRRGKVCYLLAGGDVSWDRLVGFAFIDAFIVVGCPRIATDNQECFSKPVLNAGEALEVIKRL